MSFPRLVPTRGSLRVPRSLQQRVRRRLLRSRSSAALLSPGAIPISRRLRGQRPWPARPISLRLVRPHRPPAPSLSHLSLPRPARLPARGPPAPAPTTAAEPVADFMVSLQAPLGSHRCGATLIAPDMLLTAAHCVEPLAAFGGALVRVGDASVVIGAVLSVAAFAVPSTFSTAEGGDDIALGLILGANFAEWAVTGAPAPVGAVLGWGALHEGGPFSARMHVALMDQRDAAWCAAAVGRLAAGTFCAEAEAAPTCVGDSGSPLLATSEVAAGGSVALNGQFGIVSWARGSCGASQTTVFTNISHHADWIASASTCLRGGVCENSSFTPLFTGGVPPAPPAPPLPPMMVTSAAALALGVPLWLTLAVYTAL